MIHRRLTICYTQSIKESSLLFSNSCGLVHLSARFEIIDRRAFFADDVYMQHPCPDQHTADAFAVGLKWFEPRGST